MQTAAATAATSITTKTNMDDNDGNDGRSVVNVDYGNLNPRNAAMCPWAQLLFADSPLIYTSLQLIR